MTILGNLKVIAQTIGPVEIRVAQEGDVFGVIAQPDFTPRKFVQDWERYIPESLQVLWSELSPEAKLVAAIVAERAATMEVCD